MSQTFAIPTNEARAEIEVERSRFIASIAPARSIEEARDYMKRIRSEFTNATHNVPAYIIGGGNQVTDYCSDDGEPSGTSGMPVLMALRGSGLGDVVIVITRYFGGVLLGKGGLVKAYTTAAQAVIASVERGYPRQVDEIEFVVGYEGYETIKKLIHKFGGLAVSEEFGVDVSIRCSILENDTQALLKQGADQFAGKLIYELVGKKEMIIPA